MGSRESKEPENLGYCYLLSRMANNTGIKGSVATLGELRRAAKTRWKLSSLGKEHHQRQKRPQVLYCYEYQLG
jgi:hypothetical protein